LYCIAVKNSVSRRLGEDAEHEGIGITVHPGNPAVPRVMLNRSGDQLKPTMPSAEPWGQFPANHTTGSSIKKAF
jgi:hypothetical protein